MDEASREALSRAFELSAREPQPWGADAILKVAGEFRGFLEDPTLTEMQRDLLAEALSEIDSLRDRVSALEHGPAPRRTRQRSTPASTTTETNPPDLDLDPGDVPTPVDF